MGYYSTQGPSFSSEFFTAKQNRENFIVFAEKRLIFEKTLDSAHNFLYNNSVIIPGNCVPIRIGVKNIIYKYLAVSIPQSLMSFEINFFSFNSSSLDIKHELKTNRKRVRSFNTFFTTFISPSTRGEITFVRSLSVIAFGLFADFFSTDHNVSY